MTPKLTAENAVIKTASVEVKTLTISGKQVTLAVFRQLPEIEVIDLRGKLRGVLWGRVNYCPDKNCGKWPGHVHVVWQEGESLRRATVYPPHFVVTGRVNHDGYHSGFILPESEPAYEMHEYKNWIAGLKDGDERKAKAIAELGEILSEYRRSFSQVENLDQLFIAV